MAMAGWMALVVEDEPDGQLVVSGILEYFQVVTNAVGTAEAALQALAEGQYQVAIIDLALPGMDGLDLMRTIRQNPATASLPCMAITAYHTSSVKQQAMDSGFNAYLAKPINDAMLVQELRRIVAG